jgi:hypothetical protein
MIELIARSSGRVGTRHALKHAKDGLIVHRDAKNPNVDVAKEILRYFLRNPGAADNLIGIARWRLMQESVRHSVEKTGEALRWLITEGYIREEQHLASGRIFQLNAELRDEAEEFLRGTRGGARDEET